MQLRTIESVALIPRVSSTLDLGSRVVAECIENEVPVPSAMILAREQSAGRGRNGRSWHSPSGRGIYATMTFTVPSARAGILPLSFAVATARFIRERWDIDAKLKWPNDVLVEGRRKIAGILISARHHEKQAYVAAGIGINLCHLDDAPEHAVSVEDLTGAPVDLDEASEAFIRWFDSQFDRERPAEEILEDWRSLSIHQTGDPIRCLVGDDVIAGNWAGLDPDGHAMLDKDGEPVRISAGDLIVWK
jgi:BirA family biotin operon repressor/biotin-[acetyl-CoA-carboxylase] ligase